MSGSREKPTPQDPDLAAMLREAAEAGAQPPGVPMRTYAGYVEARAALRANAPDAAIRTLKWLLGQIADGAGAAADEDLPGKLDSLFERNAISTRVRETLFSRALAPEEGLERAWALMSIVEHAFYRLYVRPERSG